MEPVKSAEQNPQEIKPQSIGEIPIQRVVQQSQLSQTQDSVSQSIPQQPVNNTNSSNIWIKIIIVFLIFIIIVLGIYDYLKLSKDSVTVQDNKMASAFPTMIQTLLTSTPIPTIVPIIDQTANWKTYTDNQGSYIFKYPLNWNQCDQNDLCVKSSTIEEKFIEGGEGGGKMIITKGGKFTVVKTDRTKEMKLEDSCQPGGPIDVISCNQSVIDGKQAMKRVDGNPEESTIYFILTDKYQYAINLFYSFQDKEATNILNQILSTFKFLK